MTEARIQRPEAGDGKDPIVRPCPTCGKYISNDAIHDLELQHQPGAYLHCSSPGCPGQLHYYGVRGEPTYKLDWLPNPEIRWPPEWEALLWPCPGNAGMRPGATDWAGPAAGHRDPPPDHFSGGGLSRQDLDPLSRDPPQRRASRPDPRHLQPHLGRLGVPIPRFLFPTQVTCDTKLARISHQLRWDGAELRERLPHDITYIDSTPGVEPRIQELPCDHSRGGGVPHQPHRLPERFPVARQLFASGQNLNRLYIHPIYTFSGPDPERQSRDQNLSRMVPFSACAGAHRRVMVPFLWPGPGYLNMISPCWSKSWRQRRNGTIFQARNGTVYASCRTGSPTAGQGGHDWGPIARGKNREYRAWWTSSSTPSSGGTGSTGSAPLGESKREAARQRRPGSERRSWRGSPNRAGTSGGFLLLQRSPRGVHG